MKKYMTMCMILLALTSTEIHAQEPSVSVNDSLFCFTFPSKWNTDTYQYERAAESEPITLTVSCPDEIEGPTTVTLTYVPATGPEFLAVFMQPEGVSSCEIEDNQITFCVNEKGEYPVSLYLRGKDAEGMTREEILVGQILVKAESSFDEQEETVFLSGEEPMVQEELSIIEDMDEQQEIKEEIEEAEEILE